MSDLLKTPLISEEKIGVESQSSTSQETQPISEADNAFTENCECIENIKFNYPVIYNEYDPEQYVKVTSSKVDAYIQEVMKHAHSKGDEKKKCHRKLHTTSIVFVRTQKKHRKTLLVIRQVLYGLESPENFKVKFGAQDVSLEDYVKAVDQACNYYIITARAFQNPQSKTTFVQLLTCLKNHKQSLIHLQRLIEYRKSCVK